MISNKLDIEKRDDLLCKEVAVTVAEVINPANFYLVLQDKDDEYKALKQNLRRYYASNSYSLPISVDKFYATQNEDTKEFSRVKVLNATSKNCYCFFIDEGFSFYIPDEKLFLLDDQFKRLPPRSFKAGLLGMYISDHLNYSHQYSASISRLQVTVPVTVSGPLQISMNLNSWWMVLI